VFPEGNAALLAPEISVGDELIATSGLTYTTQQVAPAARPLPAPSTRCLVPALLCAPTPIPPTKTLITLDNTALPCCPVLQTYQDNVVRGGAALACPCAPALPCSALSALHLLARLCMLVGMRALLFPAIPSAHCCCLWHACRGDLCAAQCAQQRFQNSDGSHR
jgi:hypothetical protein